MSLSLCLSLCHINILQHFCHLILYTRFVFVCNTVPENVRELASCQAIVGEIDQKSGKYRVRENCLLVKFTFWPVLVFLYYNSGCMCVVLLKMMWAAAAWVGDWSALSEGNVRQFHSAWGECSLFIQYTLRVWLLKWHCSIMFVTVRLHDSIQDEGFHYLVFDLWVYLTSYAAFPVSLVRFVLHLPVSSRLVSQ